MEYKIPKYEPICGNCGHTANHHNYDSCTFHTVLNPLNNSGFKACTCRGWAQALNWPPPIVVVNNG